jgi:TRAP transporter TAXI family solute receptor
VATQHRPKVVPPPARGRAGSQWVVWCVVAGLCLLVLIVPYLLFVEKPPPRHIKMATGGKAGAYYGFGQQYKELLAKDGITVEVLSTEGSPDNLKRLTDDASGVSVAIVQSGVASDEQGEKLYALGSLYREPLWIFYRGSTPLHLVSDLKGKRLSIGPPNSGTRVAALEILKANDIDPLADLPEDKEKAEALKKLQDLPSDKAAEALKKGDIDAAFFVAGVGAAYIGGKDGLLAADGVRLMSLGQHEAYERRYRHFSGVVVPAGLVDLGKNIPAEDTHLIGPTAMLVVRKDFHPELVGLLLAAATRIHGKATLLSQPGEFPSAHAVDLPLHEDAASYYKSGPPMLQRILPFWAASQVDRLKIMLIPVIMLMMPLVRLTPPLVRWRTRRKIYLWYNSLRDIDEKLIAGISVQDLRHELTRLREIEDQVAAVNVPLSYMEEFYNMRFHLQVVRNKLEKMLAEKGEPVTPPSPPATGIRADKQTE